MTGRFRSSTSYLVAAAVLAMCSLSYELVFAQIIAEFTGNATIWESVSMAVFLCGMGARSLLFKNEDAATLGRRLIATELGLIGGAILCYFLVMLMQGFYRIYIYDGGITRELWRFPPVFVLGASAQVGPFLLGWLTAFELQFFLHWPSAPAFKFKESAVLAAYHFGALAGTAAFVVARRNAIEPVHLLAATVAFNLAFALYMTQLLGLWRQFWRPFGLAMALVVVSFFVEGRFAALLLKNHYFNVVTWSFDASGLKEVEHPMDPKPFLAIASNLPEVLRIRSPFQVMDVVPDRDGGPASLFINGRFQIGSGSAERYHETFTHVSLGYKESPAKRVLILGGGDGVLAAELLKRSEVEVIDLVEIDQEVLDLAASHEALKNLNHGALANPRVKVHREDAMAFVRRQGSIYDAVFIDLTYPYDFDSARFFGVEFFRMIERDLLPGGVLVAGLPSDMVHPEDEFPGMIEATLTAAGFQSFVAYGNGNDHFMAVGKNSLLPVWKLSPGLELKELSGLKINATAVRRPNAGAKVLTVMRPRLLMTNDTFY